MHWVPWSWVNRGALFSDRGRFLVNVFEIRPEPLGHVFGDYVQPRQSPQLGFGRPIRLQYVDHAPMVAILIGWVGEPDPLSLDLLWFSLELDKVDVAGRLSLIELCLQAVDTVEPKFAYSGGSGTCSCAPHTRLQPSRTGARNVEGSASTSGHIQLEEISSRIGDERGRIWVEPLAG